MAAFIDLINQLNGILDKSADDQENGFAFIKNALQSSPRNSPLIKTLDSKVRPLCSNLINPINRPSKFLITKWGEDLFSKGSWSILNVEGSLADRAVLASPISNSFILAGEACSTNANPFHGSVNFISKNI
jgi:hypothetical protein